MEKKRGALKPAKHCARARDHMHKGTPPDHDKRLLNTVSRSDSSGCQNPALTHLKLQQVREVEPHGTAE